MSERYFVESPITTDRAVLAGAEAHHLIHVMRLKPGARVTLFDGSGSQFAAAVERVGRAEVELAILSQTQIDRELPLPVWLGVALPKGDRQKWLVEKAVELGVSRLLPLETARGVAQPMQQALERLRRTVIEASKQCGRNRLMEIALPQRWEQFVHAADGMSRRLLAHPHGIQHTECAVAGGPRSVPDALKSGGVALAVGPEGGFTDDEVVVAQAAGWTPVALGPRILRVETAALALVARVTRGND
jgi:16S rRNA (uracil1498-N3)-methyltransferase